MTAFIIAMVIMILLSAFLWIQNNYIKVSQIEYKSERLPKGFNGFKIVHLSDLHNKSFGKNNERLISKIRTAAPDMIVITGDIIDRRRGGDAGAMSLVKGIVKIAPTFYVPGNHEETSGIYKSLRSQLCNAGVNVITNSFMTIVHSKSTLKLCGVNDPFSFINDEFKESVKNRTFEEFLKDLSVSCGQDFKVLLSHRPDKLPLYSKCNFDLVFSGHAHGGQIRLPFIGGLFAPDEGVFPKLTNGIHTNGNTSIVISRGLGNSAFPFRIFNYPEVVVVTLKR